MRASFTTYRRIGWSPYRAALLAFFDLPLIVRIFG